MKIKKILALVLVFIAMFSFTACFENEGGINIAVSINFDTNGGTECESIAQVDLSNIVLPKNPEKTGYDFSGWYFDKEAVNNPVTVESLKKMPLAGEITLYAGWTAVVTSVTLDKSTLTLEVGESAALKGRAMRYDGSVAILTWTSSDSSVATVISGLVTAIENGSAIVTAKAGSFSQTCEITVLDAAEKEPVIDPALKDEFREPFITQFNLGGVEAATVATVGADIYADYTTLAGALTAGKSNIIFTGAITETLEGDLTGMKLYLPAQESSITISLAADAVIDAVRADGLFNLDLNGYKLTAGEFVVNSDSTGELAITNGTITVSNLGNYILNAPNATIIRTGLKHNLGGAMLNSNTNANGTTIFDPRAGEITENEDSLSMKVVTIGSDTDGPYASVGKWIPWINEGFTVLVDVEFDSDTFDNSTDTASFCVDMNMTNTSGVYGTERRINFVKAKGASVITVNSAHAITNVYTPIAVTLPTAADETYKYTVGFSWYDDGNGYLNCALFVLDGNGNILVNGGNKALWFYDEGKFYDKIGTVQRPGSFNGTSAHIGRPGALWFIGKNATAKVSSVLITNNTIKHESLLTK